MRRKSATWVVDASVHINDIDNEREYLQVTKVKKIVHYNAILIFSRINKSISCIFVKINSQICNN